MKVFSQITKAYLPNYRHSQYHFLQKHLITGTESAQIDTFRSCFEETSDLREDGDNGEMANNGDKPNGYDLVYKIQECTSLGLCNHGQQLHCYALRSGFTSNV